MKNKKGTDKNQNKKFNKQYLLPHLSGLYTYI